MSWKEKPVSHASRRPRIQWTHDVCACLSLHAPARLTLAVPAHGDAPPPICCSPAARTNSACSRRPPTTCASRPRPRPSKTRVIAGLPHRHALQRDGSIAHTGTSGTTPHGKNESIARAGIESKQEWHDTARQKQEHRMRWYRKQAGVIWHDHPTQAAAGYGR